MAEVVETGPTAPPVNGGEISAPPMQTQYNSPSLSRKPLLLSIEHPNAASSNAHDRANPKTMTTSRTPNFITPLGSPIRRAIKMTRLDPQDAWLPITESRNGNTFYAAFHTLCAGIGIQALVLPVSFTILG
ncbi:UNVERIFIED_CONTAM: Lysine histidine transporter-like 8, partial [Sesamum indicum]